jgi:hypothetical protein
MRLYFRSAGCLAVLFLLVLILPSCVSATSEGQQQPNPPYLRGIYVIISDTITSGGKSSATKALMASLSVPGVDGVVLVIGWNYTEPAMGQYKWDTLDYWMSTAIASAKKVDLVVDAGIFTPSWLFQPAPTGAGAIPLTFKISPHEGKTAICQSETIAPPWDSAFLTQWDSMLTALAAHLRSVGTYKAVTLLRLTGINRSTDELRLPAETNQSTGLDCVSDAVSIWQQAGYRPSLLLHAWDEITDSFKKSFPDKSFSVAIIPPSLSPFPPIAEDGSIITGTVPDQDEPLLALASRKVPNHLVVQFNFLMPPKGEGGQAANPTVIQAAETLGTMAAFQTNNWLAATTKEVGKEAGAACGGTVTNSTPCTPASYLALLQNGIYPDKSLRAVYIEVWPSNVNAFPDDIQQAHLELLAPLRNNLPGLLKGWALFNMSVAARAVTHAIFLNGTHRVELAEIAINASSNGQMIENVAFNESIVKIDFDHDGSVELSLNSSAKPSAVYADDMQLGEAQSSNGLNLNSNEWVYDHHMIIIFADPSSVTIFYSPTPTPVPEFPVTLTALILIVALSASLIVTKRRPI